MADIYINSDESSLALCRESRDGLEDDLDEFFGSAGQTCGGGAALGSAAWNVDVQVTDEDNLPLWVERLCGFLRGWGVPRDTELVVLPSGWVEGMESQRVPVFPVAAPSRETFAADPAGQLWAEGVQPEWVADAYSADEGFRAAAAEALAESVRKRGDLGLVGGWVALLSASLSGAQASDLFRRIETHADCPDGEWRGEFRELFPAFDAG